MLITWKHHASIMGILKEHKYLKILKESARDLVKLSLACLCTIGTTIHCILTLCILSVAFGCVSTRVVFINDIAAVMRG